MCSLLSLSLSAGAHMAAHVGGRASSHRGRGRGGAWEGAVPGGVVVLLLLASAPAPLVTISSGSIAAVLFGCIYDMWASSPFGEFPDRF